MNYMGMALEKNLKYAACKMIAIVCVQKHPDTTE